VIHQEFAKLKMNYPIVSEAQKAELQKAKVQLMAEDDDKKKKSGKSSGGTRKASKKSE
jgi:hypothetical protein